MCNKIPKCYLRNVHKLVYISYGLIDSTECQIGTYQYEVKIVWASPRQHTQPPLETESLQSLLA